MKKIAIMGVHSAGKTTLAYILSAFFKMQNYNVKLIHESVRENCPFPINADATQDTCLWNFHTQFLNELEAKSQGYELAVCDRSVLDTFVYFHAVNPETSITRSAVKQAAEWMVTYDTLICMEPSEGVELQDDGVRSTDGDYLKIIQEGFRQKVERYCTQIAEKILYATSDDVFVEEKRNALLNHVSQTLFSVNLSEVSEPALESILLG